MALGRTAQQCIFDNLLVHNRYPYVELAALEVFQALFLTIEYAPSQVPTSPHNFSKNWKTLAHLLKAFSRRQSSLMTGDDPKELLRHRVRVQTMYYRFPFTQGVCKEIIQNILRRLDDSAGYPNSTLASDFGTFTEISALVCDRSLAFMETVSKLMETDSVKEAETLIEFFCGQSISARRLWNRCKAKPWSLEELRVVGYQLSELATPSIFLLEKTEIEDRFGEAALTLVEQFSMQPGDLNTDDFERCIMDNHVWQKPFIRRHDGGYMLAIPYFPYSYPFKIAEALIGTDQKRLNVYSKVRSDYLEDAIADLVEHAMPSANVYRNVLWDDPATGVRYENDILAVLGNFLFVFEAKSGKISPASRRGAEKSLSRDIRQLFIEPREQSSRLQNYLNQYRDAAKLWEKQGGKHVIIDLSKPKLAFSYSVCYEHFASTSSSKHYFTSAGLFDEGTPWAPVFSLGELRMLSDFLDSEVSITHYLTRRYWLESQIEFDGDEQDLLSMYLTNGFCLLGEFPKNNRLLLYDSDDLVRTHKTPASNRRTSKAVAVQLPSLWKTTVDEIYRSGGSTARHKFDIICIILNQPPAALYELQQRVRKWRRGAGGAAKGPQASIYSVASRQFVLAVTLRGKNVLDEETLENEARLLAANAANDFEGVSDVAVFLYYRKSPQSTHDDVFFFRIGRRDMEMIV